MIERMNISVPDSVKRRMDGFPNENWSQVAVRAFESHLVGLEGKRTMEHFGLDMFIAEHLFGWKFSRTQILQQKGQDFIFVDQCRDDQGRLRNVSEVPPFSTNIKVLGDAYAKAAKKGIFIAVQKPAAGEERLVRGGMKGKSMLWATADTEKQIPEAICKLIYRLLTEN
jgi:hypothetical protein